MYVLSVHAPKGGPGKSTTTKELAGAFVARGKSVLVIDQDPQLSLLHIAKAAERKGKPLPFRVISIEDANEAPTEDVVLFDHSPRVSESDRPQVEVHGIIMPVRPSILDLDSLDQAKHSGFYDAYTASNVAVIPFWNSVDRRSLADARFMAEHDPEREWPVVRYLSAIRDATNLGVSVFDTSDATLRRRFAEARKDYDALLDYILAKIPPPWADTLALATTEGDHA